MATHRFISLDPEFVKALKDDKAKAKAEPKPEPEPEDEDTPDATNEDEPSDGPESDEATDALRALTVKAWQSWLDAHGDMPAEAPKDFEWAAPESEGETAAAFAERAAKYLRDTPEGESAADAIGEGDDFIDWVTAVMRYEGGDAKEAAEKSLSRVPGAEMVKSIKDSGDLTPDETMMVLHVRLTNAGEAWYKADREYKAAKVDTGSPNVPSCYAYHMDCTPEEFADLQADSAVERLAWEGGSSVAVMRKLGGVMQYHDWTAAQVLEGINAAKAKAEPVAAPEASEAANSPAPNAATVPDPTDAPVA